MYLKMVFESDYQFDWQYGGWYEIEQSVLKHSPLSSRKNALSEPMCVSSCLYVFKWLWVGNLCFCFVLIYCTYCKCAVCPTMNKWVWVWYSIASYRIDNKYNVIKKLPVLSSVQSISPQGLRPVFSSTCFLSVYCAVWSRILFCPRLSLRYTGEK